MNRLYYILWAVRILAGLFVEIWDAINHWRDQ